MTAESNVENSPPDEIRSAREVAVRALALFAPVGVALGAPRLEVVSWLKEEQLWEEVTGRFAVPMEVPADSGNRLRRLRTHLKLSLTDLAELVGAANKAVVYQWESG